MVRLISVGFFLTFTGARFWALRRLFTASAVSASISPLRTSPVRARASQTQTAIEADLIRCGQNPSKTGDPLEGSRPYTGTWRSANDASTRGPARGARRPFHGARLWR